MPKKPSKPILYSVNGLAEDPGNEEPQWQHHHHDIRRAHRWKGHGDYGNSAGAQPILKVAGPEGHTEDSDREGTSGPALYSLHLHLRSERTLSPNGFDGFEAEESAAAALPNPHSAPGSPVQRVHDWDLGRQSFMVDRGAGLVGHAERMLERGQAPITECRIDNSNVQRRKDEGEFTSLGSVAVMGPDSKILRRVPKTLTLTEDSRYPALATKRRDLGAHQVDGLPC